MKDLIKFLKKYGGWQWFSKVNQKAKKFIKQFHYKKVIDRGNMCLHCRKDTKFGSGRFVNRHPANVYNMELGVEENGYCCDECEQEYYKDNPEIDD